MMTMIVMMKLNFVLSFESVKRSMSLEEVDNVRTTSHRL